MAEEAQPQISISPSSSSSAANSTQAMDTSALQNQENTDRGQGLYAVQCSSLMGMMPEFPPSMLIPLRYKIPTRANSAAEEAGQGGDAVRQQPGPEGEVALRRIHVEIQLDLTLLIKLAFIVALFGQDGSRQRKTFLILLATIVYFYQTGMLTSIIRFVRRELIPLMPFARLQNAERQNNAEDNGGNVNQRQPAEGEQPPEPERANGLNLWGIAREIKTFVVGFVTSLLPVFEHQHD